MSFFKDFKADFSQAMNELMPDSNEMYDEDEVVEEERNKKKDKAVAKAEKQAKRAAKSKKTEDKEDREDRKVKAVRPPKEVPLKTKVVEEPEDEDLGIAPEDMSDQVDELLDNELYSDENDPSMLLQDDMEVNTMDMSVAEMLNQLSEKQEPVGEQLSVDDLLSQLGQSSSVPEEMEEAPEPVPETISDQDEQVDTSVGGKDLGLEELLASIGAKQATPATETIAEEVEEELVEEETEEDVIEEPEEEFEEEVIEEAEEEELEEEVIEELEEEELEEEVMEEPEEEELEEDVIEEPEEEFVEEVEELEDVPVQASIPEEKPVAPTRSVSAQDEDALLTQKLEELARSMNKQATNVKEEPLSEPVAEVIEEVVEPVKETTDTIEKAAEPVKAAVEIIENASETTEEIINPVEEVAEPVKTKKDNKKEIKENVEDNKMSEEKDVISINAVEEEKAAEVKAEEVKAEEVEETAFNVEDADDETTYVTKATKISGDLETEGSIDIIGNINGNVSCKGKIVIGGQVKGNILAGELYANNARVEGDIKSYGSVKVGVGSMILGGIKAESAVIAGAVNGDIDVNGPVIVDSTAVIMGNINSRSVQINNGAVIEGFCSQSYSEIDVKNYFS